jgi:hypothetical protein
VILVNKLKITFPSSSSLRKRTQEIEVYHSPLALLPPDANCVLPAVISSYVGVTTP